MILLTNLLHTYEPLKAALGMNFYAAFILLISFLAVSAYLYNMKLPYEQRSRRNIVLMMLLFGALLAGGTSLFTWVNSWRISSLHVYDNKITTFKGDLAYDDLKRAYLYADKQSSHLSAQLILDTTFLLVIEDKDNKTQVFSEEYYPVKEIVVTINEALNASVKK